MRVLIVAPNMSHRMGGEAVLPLHYVRELRKAGVETHALTHARVRAELEASEYARTGPLHFVEDSRTEIALHGMSERAPAALSEPLFGTSVAAVTLARLARRARELDASIPFDVVHQPTPVSPLFPSFLTGLAAPVVIGPLNGAMSYPPGFERDYGRGGEAVIRAARLVAGVANRAAPGKLRAARILAANERTLRGLPSGIAPERVSIMPENGVDLDLWTKGRGPDHDAPPTFAYVGRLIRWKAVDLLIEAFSRVQAPAAKLLIIGDGDERAALETLAASKRTPRLGIEFPGFRPQAEINAILGAATALVLPSLRECGGAAVLESFACGTPVIATAWGGPKDYMTPETGFLIAPEGREEFIRGIAAAMQALCADPALRARMGAAARARVETHYSWRAKARAMIDIYRSVMPAPQRAS